MKTNFTEQDLQFYPTPKSLLDRITDSLKWTKITSVLEPSAGKGDIAEYVKEKLNTSYTRYDIQIDCIEKDSALRKILEGKEYHVIHDDFLTYHGRKGEITFESIGAIECKEYLKTIKLKNRISWESTLRKDKIGTVICNMPTTDAFAGFTDYSVYLTEDNPKYAISLMQKKMKDRIIFLQK